MWRRRQDKLANLNLVDVRPVRVAEWEERDGRITVHRPLPKTTGLRRLVDRLLFEMSTRRIRLDMLGSFTWKQLDGARTVAEVAALLRDKYGQEVEPAEERVGKLVQMLHSQLLVEYPGIDD
jgi:hypothetical protein